MDHEDVHKGHKMIWDGEKMCRLEFDINVVSLLPHESPSDVEPGAWFLVNPKDIERHYGA